VAGEKSAHVKRARTDDLWVIEREEAEASEMNEVRGRMDALSFSPKRVVVWTLLVHPRGRRRDWKIWSVETMNSDVSLPTQRGKRTMVVSLVGRSELEALTARRLREDTYVKTRKECITDRQNAGCAKISISATFLIFKQVGDAHCIAGQRCTLLMYLLLSLLSIYLLLDKTRFAVRSYTGCP